MAPTGSRHASSENDEALTPDTKNRLIQAAILLFSDKGFEGTTVKNISDLAGVNISLISYHFAGKEGLYRTCLEKFGRTQLASSEMILKDPQSLEEFKIRLQMFVEEFFISHMKEPELIRIVTRECDLQGGSTIAADIFKDIFIRNYENVVRFFKNAQEKGFLRKDLDMHISCGLFFGGLIQTVQKDRINEVYFGLSIRNESYRNQVIRHAISSCLHGCENPESKVDRSLR